MPHRKADVKSTWFHSDRIYLTPEGWWFSSREHTEEGPFESKEEAEANILIYVRSINLSQAYISN